MRRALLLALALTAVGWSDEIAKERADLVATARAAHDERLHFAWRGRTRARLDGQAFPDGVVALTWDDGPDVHTLALAQYLRAEHVSGTFFVVGEWIGGISEEPGTGPAAFTTGYEHLPVLGSLVGLGHRLGNHTRNHGLLWKASGPLVAEQLGRAQMDIDPFLSNELRMFRPPAGAWSPDSDTLVAGPLLSDVVGPIGWDIDRKDWEGSVYCRSSRPKTECEPVAVRDPSRVRPDVTAERYFSAIRSAKHGIVLLHDRVGDVGSRYAVDVARRLVPKLKASGFVFAAPILAFGEPSDRAVWSKKAEGAATELADVDGDGKADLCRQRGDAIVCLRAETARGAPTHPVPRTAFAPRELETAVPPGVRGYDLGDVDGDGRADLCVVTDDAIACARSNGAPGIAQAFGKLEPWSRDLAPAHGGTYARSFRLADVDGDGRADACARSPGGIVCASSRGAAFGPPHVWLDIESALPAAPRLDLGDVDGDGRADVCGAASGGIACSLSSGTAFGAPSKWSLGDDFATSGRLDLADLNGDGRLDACASMAGGVGCALSNGHGFTAASLWLEHDRAGSLALADVNGDRRADLCLVGADRVACGMAP